MTVSRGNFNKPQQITSCRLVATSNVSGTYNNGPSNDGVGATLTLNSSSLTVDSVAAAPGDSILLMNQTAANQNGVYYWSSAAGANVVLKRRDDMQSIGSFGVGYYVPIEAGTLNAGAMFIVVEPFPQHFGIDDLVITASPLNSGFGTAATKDASDNSKDTVASVDGVTVAANVLMAADTAGTVQDSGAPNTGLYQVASVSISSADFKGMYETPKLLVAAPGANKLIVVDRLLLIYTFSSAAYASGGDVVAQYDSTAHAAGVFATNPELGTDFEAAASATFAFNGIAGDTVGALPFTTTVNKGLYLSNDTGAFTTGSGTFVAKVFYRIITVA